MVVRASGSAAARAHPRALLRARRRRPYNCSGARGHLTPCAKAPRPAHGARVLTVRPGRSSISPAPARAQIFRPSRILSSSKTISRAPINASSPRLAQRCAITASACLVSLRSWCGSENLHCIQRCAQRGAGAARGNKFANLPWGRTVTPDHARCPNKRVCTHLHSSILWNQGFSSDSRLTSWRPQGPKPGSWSCQNSLYRLSEALPILLPCQKCTKNRQVRSKSPVPSLWLANADSVCTRR